MVLHLQAINSYEPAFPARSLGDSVSSIRIIAKVAATTTSHAHVRTIALSSEDHGVYSKQRGVGWFALLSGTNFMMYHALLYKTSQRSQFSHL